MVSAVPLNLHITWLTHLAVAEEDKTESLLMICSHSLLKQYMIKYASYFWLGVYFKSLTHSKCKRAAWKKCTDEQSKPERERVLVCACGCRPASIFSIWRPDVVGYFWAKPQELIQSQFCYQRCSREIRYSTKRPRTAADAPHWENEVGAAANSLNQHNAYITVTGYRQIPVALQCKPLNIRENPGGVQTPRLPNYKLKVG